MTLRLFDYAASANCYKVRLLLSQLEHDYERVPVDIFAGDTLTPEFMAKNPSLATPVLEAGPNQYLAESGAILLYLAEGTPLMPKDAFSRAQVHQWMFYEQSTVLTIIGNLRFRLLTGRLSADSAEAQRLARIGSAIVTTVDAHLASRTYLVGDTYCVADIAV